MSSNSLTVTAWTPESIANLLRDNTHAGTIVLSRQLLPELERILLQIGVSELTLSAASEPVIKGRIVTVKGTGAFLAASGTVTLSIAVPLAGSLQIDLSAGADKWKFSDAFPGVLPKYTAFVDDRSLEPQDSFFNGLTVENATLVSADYDGVTETGVAFVAGLNLAGKLPIAGTPLEPISFIIPPGDLPLSLAGTITLQGSGKPPAINLRAVIPGLSFDLLGQLRLDPVFLWLEVRLGPEAPESRVSLASTIKLGSLQPMIISTALLQGDFVWVFEVVPEESAQLRNGLQDLAGLAGPFFGDLRLPPEVARFVNISLVRASVGIVPSTKSLNFISFVLRSNEEWIPPVPKITIKDVQFGFTIYNPLGNSNVTGFVAGTFQIGESEPVRLRVTARFPEYTISAELMYGDRIQVKSVIEKFLGRVNGLPKFDIYQLMLWVTPPSRSFGLNSAIELGWTIPIIPGLFSLELQNLFLDIFYSPTTLSGSISASLRLLQANFTVTAAYPGQDAGWIFSGALDEGQSISLKTIAEELLRRPVSLPGGLDTLSLNKLSANIYTAKCTYDFAAGLTWKPDIPFFPVSQVDALLKLKTEREKCSDEAKFSGSVQGDFRVLRLVLTILFEFQPDSKTVTFKIGSATAVLVKKGTGEMAETILTVNLGNTSFGDIVTYLVNLADPNANFKLQAPWSVLNDISLKNLTLTVNFTKNTIGISYKLDKLNLGIVELNEFGLIYSRRNNKGSVDLKIGGRFLEKTYDYQDNPLEWDLLNEPAPEVPGKGPKLLDLQYLGFGQHVTLSNIDKLNSVAEIIDALKQYAAPVKDPSKKLPSGVIFSAESQWLIGAQFTVMETVTLSAVFNDPNLYGLLVSLAGEKAAKFAGLSFEILYKKVTDNIGVYHIELKLPDSVRQLEFGQVSITLPIVALDIYTNGNFRIDFGFPRGLDFTRSFSIQAFPFVGFGGFYFALLNGATSKRVPQITNGEFSPVIEFGLALSLGLGKTINKGPLSAGLTVTAVGILEGVIGWFNPNDPAVKSDRFYLVQGSVSLVGKLFGKVDLGIISAEVSVTAYANVMVIVESYAAIVIELSVGVSVSIDVKLLFFTIHLSFEMQLREKFTIGSSRPTPWKKVGGNLRALRLAPPRQLRAQRALYRYEPLLLALSSQTIDAFDWTPPKLPDGPFRLRATLTPSFTVAAPEFLYPADGKAAGSAAEIQAVMQIFVENGIAPSARGKQIRVMSTAGAGEQPFNVFAKGVFLWALNAALGRFSGEVRLADLEHLQDVLADPKHVQEAFTSKNIDDFLTRNFVLEIFAPPQTAASMRTAEEARSSTPFPMIPALRYTKPDGRKVDFDAAPLVQPEYQAKVTAYFEQLMEDPRRRVALDPFAAAEPPRAKLMIGPETTEESLARVVFKDYFALIARTLVQNAVSLLGNYSYDLGGEPTLGEIAAMFGVTSESVLTANQDTGRLRAGAQITLSTILYQAGSSDSLSSIAAKFPGITALSLASANTADYILRPGATMRLDSISYTVEPLDSVEFIASFLLVRNGLQTEDEYFAWLRQTVVTANSEKIDFAQPVLQPGVKLDIPDAGTYTTRPYDTLDFVSGYFTVFNRRLFAGPFFDALKQRYPAVTPGQKLQIPQLVRTLAASDTLQSISDLMNTGVGAIAASNESATDLLSPLSVLVVPPVTLSLTGSETIAAIATHYNVSAQEIAAAAAGVNIFAANQTLTIVQAQKIDIDVLSQTMLANHYYNNVSATVSRFLLHGARLPDPENAEFRALTVDQILNGKQRFDLYGLYDMTGQQFTVSEDTLDLTFENSGDHSWVAFNGSVEEKQLPIRLTNIAQDFPGKILKPHSKTAAMPFVIDVPNRYPLEQMIHWQTATSIDFTNTFSAAAPAAGEPVLWLFPEQLQRRLALEREGDTVPFLLFGIAKGSPRGTRPSQIKRAMWATVVQFRVRKAGNPNGYLVVGADQNNRELLRLLWTYRRKAPLELYLLYSPNPTDPNPSGLASDDLQRTLSFQLKTNLSTLTHSGPVLLAGAAFGAPPSGDYFATLESLASADFIRLLWEASVVGTGGFYLNYVNRSNNGGLPASAFDENDEATLRLIVVHRGQGSQLAAFNNCAIVGDNIDPTVVSIFAERELTGLGVNPDVSQAPLFAAGNIGYDVIRPNPGDPVTPDGKTASLYSLLSCEISRHPLPEPISRQSGPIAPNQHDPDSTGGLPLPALLRAEPETWDFHATLPVYKVVPSSGLINCPALPSPNETPYAGIFERLNVTLDFAFYEIFGNRMNPTLDAGESSQLPVKLGYFDELIPVLQWPGMGASYDFGAGAPDPNLIVNLQLQLSAYSAGGGNTVARAIYSAAADKLKYRQIYYQIEQQDVKFTLSTSMNRNSLSQPWTFADSAPLTAFAAGSYAYLDCIERATRSTVYPVSGAPAATLQELLRESGVSGGSLFEENSSVRTSDLFGGVFQIPAFQVVRAGDTLSEISHRTGVPISTLASLNANAQLKTGTVIQVMKRTIAASTGTLADIAGEQNCTVPGLAAANETEPGIFREFAIFTFDGYTVIATQQDSFFTIAERFRSEFVPTAAVPDIAVANEQVPEIFAAGKRIFFDDYVVRSGDTLAKLAAETIYGSVEELAALNASTPDMFDMSLPLLTALTPTAPTADTLEGIIGSHDITFEQLAGQNLETAISSAARLTIPELVTIDSQVSGAYVPYDTSQADHLSSVAAKFGRTVLEIGTANRNVTGILKPDAVITIAQRSHVISIGDTLETVFLAFKDFDGIETFEEFLNRAKTYPGIIRQGGQLYAPVPKASKDSSLEELAVAFQLQPEDIARANRATLGFLHQDVEVAIRDIRLRIGSYDTFNTLVYRFGLEGILTTVDQIAAANKTVPSLIANEAYFFLPPVARQISHAVKSAYPGNIFAVNVFLGIERDPSLLAEGVDKNSAAAKVLSSIVPMTTATDSDAHSLTLFASNMEAAFPGIKAATGKRDASPRSNGPEEKQVWAVNFGLDGINVTIPQTPSVSFGILPLSNQLMSRNAVPITPYGR